MTPEALSAELERAFELNELKELSKKLLGLDPEQVGGTQAKASYVRSLVERCAETFALDALFDAISHEDRALSPALKEWIEHGNTLEPTILAQGDSCGEFTVVRQLGQSPLSVTYLCTKEGDEYRVKILSPTACLDKVGVQRFLTLSRLFGSVDHPGIPANLTAGSLDDRGRFIGVAHRAIDGEALSAVFDNTSPRRFNELVPLLRVILQPLAVMHDEGVCHGNLKLENIILVGEASDPEAVLLDAGSNYIRIRGSNRGDEAQRLNLSIGSAETISPEQIRGKAPTPRSDIYSFGAILYRLLTGRPAFEGKQPIDQMLGHLSEEPETLNSTTSAGSVPVEVEEFVLRLLDKDPAARPPNAEALLQSVEALNRASLRAAASITAEEISQRLTGLLNNPFDENEAAALEATVDAGADATQLAEGFRWVGQNLDPNEGAEVRRAQKRMVFRAARLYENATDQPEHAEGLYAWLLKVDPGDESARAALLRLRRKLGKHSEIVDDLLERAEKAVSSAERAHLYAEIGRVYERDLNEPDQALVAYSQALCENPVEPSYGGSVERLAGTRKQAWEEVLSACLEAVQGEDTSNDHKNAIYLTMGRWYSEHLGRPDLALPCYQSVLGIQPAHEEALEGVLEIFRKAQQWKELAGALLQRAEAAAPTRARELRVEAAEVLEKRLNSPDGALKLYEQVLAEDPGHQQAADAAAALHLNKQDLASYVKVLEKRAEAVGGESKLRALCQLGDAYENRLQKLDEAIKVYEQVLNEDPNHLDALRGLDRVYSKTEKFTELLNNLRSQYRVSVTPRQKVQLLERIAGIYEEQFIDHESAAETCRQIIELDPENKEALRRLARNYQALGRWMDVAQTYERLLDLLMQPTEKAELSSSLGEIYEKRLNHPDRALAAYELALEAVPTYADALAAVARLRTSVGDAEKALEALDALAREARTPQAKAEHLLKSAEILDERGQVNAALERYKMAYEANPTEPLVSQRLRTAFVERGETQAAAELIQKELERTSGDLGKARLLAELATLSLEQLKDKQRATKAAEDAIKLDPTNITAATVLGHLAFEDKQFDEAVRHYQHTVQHPEGLDAASLSRIFENYVQSLAQTGETKKALKIADEMLQRAAQDKSAALRGSQIYFSHGPPERARALADQVLQSFDQQLTPQERSTTLFRRGDAALRMGNLKLALDSLNAALDIDPKSKQALLAMARLHEARKDWRKAVEFREQAIEHMSGEERIEQLIELGDVAAEKFQDLDFAAKNYLSALGEQPKNRKVLMKLMQLYSQGKDWKKLLEVILQLAEFVTDHKQRAKYLHTAAMVSSRELEDDKRAIELLDDALEADPRFEAAIKESIDLRRKTGDAEGIKHLLKLQIRGASERKDKAAVLGYLDELAELHLNDLNDIEQAITIRKSALVMDPDNRDRQEKLVELYASDPARHLEDAQKLLATLIRQDPYRPESYKLLRHVYTKARRPDGAWCVCQALFVLNRADPDEVRFFSRMRSDSAAAAQSRLTERDFLTLLTPSQVNSKLSEIFATIEGAALSALAQPLAELGYTPEHMIDVSQHPYGAVYALAYASDILGIALPGIYQNTNDPGGLSFLSAQAPGIVCGLAGLSEELPPQAAAFMAGHQLLYFRPGWYLRQLIPTTTDLKAWLFAAIKLVTPQFPIAADVQVLVEQAVLALDKGIQGRSRDRLAQQVAKLLQEGASVDLKRWQAGVDLAADRAGFLLCDDLQTSVELIRASEDPSVALTATERVKEIITYSVSAEYLALRERLGIALGG